MNRQHVQFAGVSAAISGIASARSARASLASIHRNHSAAPRPICQEDLHPFVGWALQRAGLDPNQYRPSALNRRAHAALRVVRATCPDRARQIVEAKPELLPEVVGAILLGVSEFFRDRRVFEAIEQRILPDLLERPTIRVWSAACSDGRELYSVAMLLAHRNCLHESALLGSDCRAPAIAQARAAWYPEALLASVPRHLRAYLLPEGPGYRLDPALRQAVSWQVADLLKHGEMGTWDMILWRNMAIYLSHHKASEIWRRLTESLSPGGYLVTGKAERPGCGLPLERVAPCVYRRIQRAGGAGRSRGGGSAESAGRLLL